MNATLLERDPSFMRGFVRHLLKIKPELLKEGAIQDAAIVSKAIHLVTLMVQEQGDEETPETPAGYVAG